MANSREGTRMRTWIPFKLSSNFSKTGKTYANVFPVPVGDSAIQSFPSKISGIAFS